MDFNILDYIAAHTGGAFLILIVLVVAFWAIKLPRLMKSYIERGGN